MNGNGGNGNTVWKPVALVLVTILLTGAPGIVYSLRTWSLRDDTAQIRERQDDVRQRLAVVEAKVEALQTEVINLRAEVRQHEINTALPGGTK